MEKIAVGKWYGLPDKHYTAFQFESKTVGKYYNSLNWMAFIKNERLYERPNSMANRDWEEYALAHPIDDLVIQSYKDKSSVSDKKQNEPLTGDALLQEARRRYPDGTVFIGINANKGTKHHIVDWRDIRTFTHFLDRKDTVDGGLGKGYLYVDGKWAEIVSLPEESKPSFAELTIKYKTLEWPPLHKDVLDVDAPLLIKPEYESKIILL